MEELIKKLLQSKKELDNLTCEKKILTNKINYRKKSIKIIQQEIELLNKGQQKLF